MSNNSTSNTSSTEFDRISASIGDPDCAWTTTRNQALWTLISESRGWITAKCVDGDDSNKEGDVIKIRRNQIVAEFEPSDGGWAPINGHDGLAEAENSNDPLSWLTENADDSGDSDDDVNHGAPMAQLRRYRGGYVKTRVKIDGKSRQLIDCGDEIATLSRGISPRLFSTWASTQLGLPSSLYDHLNNGQIRMNWGNRIRRYVRKLEADNNTEALMAMVAELEALSIEVRAAAAMEDEPDAESVAA